MPEPRGAYDATNPKRERPCFGCANGGCTMHDKHATGQAPPTHDAYQRGRRDALAEVAAFLDFEGIVDGYTADALSVDLATFRGVRASGDDVQLGGAS
jgi:hypothetical protein